MNRIRAHPLLATALAGALALIAIGAIALAYGPNAFAHAWLHPKFGWLAFAAAAVSLAIPAYAVTYREVVRACGGPDVPISLLVTVVVAGFSPFVPAGGFALDQKALRAVARDKSEAIARVLGLGALEWAVLAPAAWIAALVMLIDRDHRVMASLLWPWVIGVPVGTVVTLTAASLERVKSYAPLKHALEALEVLERLARELREHWSAWIGMALYWAFDIAALYCATRFLGMHLTIGELVLAFATGYALTRRSLPFAGAGTTEVLLTFSLHWVGEPVLRSLAAVVVYRAFTFVIPALPGLFVQERLRPLMQG